MTDWEQFKATKLVKKAITFVKLKDVLMRLPCPCDFEGGFDLMGHLFRIGLAYSDRYEDGVSHWVLSAGGESWKGLYEEDREQAEAILEKWSGE